MKVQHEGHTESPRKEAQEFRYLFLLIINKDSLLKSNQINYDEKPETAYNDLFNFLPRLKLPEELTWKRSMRNDKSRTIKSND